MKTGNNWFTVIVVFIVGILLIVWHDRVDILSWIVIAVGLMLIIPAIYSIISAIIRKKSDLKHSASSSTVVSSIAALALGVWMVCVPDFFVGFLAYVFGAILIFYGVFHIVMISLLNRQFVMPFWFYIIPILMVIAGIVILCTSVRTINSVVVLIMGISLVASSVNSLFENIGASPRELRDNQ